MLLLPDGSEKEIQRPGFPSILEGKYVLRTAAKLGVDAVVIEMMGIQPEIMRVEAINMFRPQILVITNVRPDHQEYMGTSKEEMAAGFASAITQQCLVFVPKEESFPGYEKRAKKVNAKILKVPEDFKKTELLNHGLETFYKRDMQLALSVGEFLDIDRQTAVSGMKKSRGDIGNLKAWKPEGHYFPKTCCFVSAFAANEPESTALALDYLKRKDVFRGKKTTALLCFRKDRGQRTLQWLRAIKEGFLSDFDRILFLGDPASRASLKKVKSNSLRQKILAMPPASPEEIMRKALHAEAETVVVGMGNMVGLGRTLVHYWDSLGRSYDL